MLTARACVAAGDQSALAWEHLKEPRAKASALCWCGRYGADGARSPGLDGLGASSDAKTSPHGLRLREECRGLATNYEAVTTPGVTRRACPSRWANYPGGPPERREAHRSERRHADNSNRARVRGACPSRNYADLVRKTRCGSV